MAEEPPSQGAGFHKLLSQGFALSLGKLLASLSTLLMTSALTSLLSKGEYAAYRQALMLFNLVAPALILGLPHALFVHLGGERRARQRAVMREGLSLVSVMGLIALALALIGFPLLSVRLNSPLLPSLALPLGLFALTSLMRQALPPPLITLERVRALATFQVLSQLAIALAVIASALFYASAAAALWLSALVSALSLLWGLRLVSRALSDKAHEPSEAKLCSSQHQREPPKPQRLSAQLQAHWGGVKLLIALGVPLGLARLLGSLSRELDKYMIAERYSPETFAVYVTGAMELPVVGVLVGALSSVLLPKLSAHFKAGQLEQMGELWRGMIQKTCLLLLPVMWLVLWLGDELILVLFSSAYAGAAAPLKIYALALPLKCAVYSSALIAAGRSRWVIISSAVALVLNVALNLLLLPRLGVNGAAWATLITQYLSTFVMWWPLCKLFKVGLSALAPWRLFGLTLVVSAAPLLLLEPLRWLMLDSGPWRSLIVLGVAYCVVLVPLYVRSGLIKSPRELLSRGLA